MIDFEDIDKRLAGIGKDRVWLAHASGRKPNAIRVALAPNANPKNRTDFLRKALSETIEKEEARRADQAKSPPEPPRYTAPADEGNENFGRVAEEFVRFNKPPGYSEIFLNDEELNLADRASRIVGSASLSSFCHDIIKAEALRILSENQGRLGTVRYPTAAQTRKIVPLGRKAHIMAAAGSPISAEVMDWDGTSDTIQVKINGLSMAPFLNDGEIVEMQSKSKSRSAFMKKGLIYLVEYDGGYTVKRYNTRKPRPGEEAEEWVENGKVKILESINPSFPEIIIKQPLEWIAWLREEEKNN